MHLDPWSRAREVACDVLRSLLKPENNIHFLPSEMDRAFFVIRFLYASGQMFFLRRLAGARHIITGLRVSSVTLGWVGAPNERAPFRFRDAIAVFADRCLTRTRIADQGLKGLS